MKRALSIFCIVGITGLVTYLAVSKHLSEERAVRLDKALADAEARVLRLEEEIEAAKERIAYLTRPQETAPAPVPANRPAAVRRTTAPPVPEPVSSEVVVATPADPTPAPGVAVAVPVPAPVPGVSELPFRYSTSMAPGLTNLIRIEGTSSMHDWQVEGTLIGGNAEFGTDFPSQRGGPAQPGPVAAKVNVFVPVRTLKSIERNGKPYSDQMDEIMYGKLRAGVHNRIYYGLTSLALKEPPRKSTGPFVFEARGILVVAGETNAVTMPVTATSTPNGNLQFAGSVQVKMTDFKISPPSPTLGPVSITTGDQVTLRFAWGVKPKDTLKAAK